MTSLAPAQPRRIAAMEPHERHLPLTPDGTFSLEAHQRYARLFDEISDVDLEGARFSAATFVGWLRGEQRDWRSEPAGRPERATATDLQRERHAENMRRYLARSAAREPSR